MLSNESTTLNEMLLGLPLLVAEVEPAHLGDVAVGRRRVGPVHLPVRRRPAEQVRPAIALRDEAVRHHRRAALNLPWQRSRERRIARVVIADQHHPAVGGGRSCRGVARTGVVEVRLEQKIKVVVAWTRTVQRHERDALDQRIARGIGVDRLDDLPVVSGIARRHLPAHRARIGLRGRVRLEFFLVDVSARCIADQKLQVDGFSRVEHRVIHLGHDAAIAREVHLRSRGQRRPEKGLLRGSMHRRSTGRSERLAGSRRVSGAEQQRGASRDGPAKQGVESDGVHFRLVLLTPQAPAITRPASKPAGRSCCGSRASERLADRQNARRYNPTSPSIHSD